MRKLALLIVLLPLAVAGCHHGRRNEVVGSGKRELQKRQVPSFTSISTQGAFNIEVVCQKELSLEVELRNCGNANCGIAIDALLDAFIRDQFDSSPRNSQFAFPHFAFPHFAFPHFASPQFPHS